MSKRFYLQLFAEAAEASGDAATETAETAAGAEAPEAEAGNADPAQDQEPSFADLTGKGGKYHDDYSKAIQDAINRRFKNQKDNQSFIDRMNPILELEAQKYGIKAGKDGSLDYEAIAKAIEKDDSLYEKEAFDKGMSVEDLREQKRLERENVALKAQNEEYARKEEADKEWSEIVQEGESLKEIYPGFDLNSEMANPDFGRLLAVLRNAGFNNAVRTAYQSVHQDEIMAQTLQYATARAAQNVSRSVAFGAKRPKENGTSSRAAGDMAHTDPTKFNLKNFEEIRRRAERGERITLD